MQLPFCAQTKCALQLGHAKVLSGVRSWQRNAVAGAALQCFCSWMVTFTDAAISQFTSLALSLAAAGCPWLHIETQHVLQVDLPPFLCRQRNDGRTGSCLNPHAAQLCCIKAKAGL